MYTRDGLSRIIRGLLYIFHNISIKIREAFIHTFQTFQIFMFSNLQVFKFPTHEIFKFSNFLSIKFFSYPIHKSPSVEISQILKNSNFLGNNRLE